MRPLRVFTWHVHGNYLYYLSQARAEFFLPVRQNREQAGGDPGYGGRGSTFPFGGNVHDIPADQVRNEKFDVILFQSRQNYLHDQHEILSPAQRRGPRICIEHNPPDETPTDTRHYVDDPGVLLVHVTAFNDLFWDSGRVPTRVIEHGVIVPPHVRYTGELPRGLVIVNHLRDRGRRLGADIFLDVRRQVPLDLVGMQSEELDGLGEVFPPDLPAFESRYRFYFHPLRFTSLGLALIEAMLVGLPVVGLATTELVTVIQNGVSGFIDTDVRKLIEPMHMLLANPAEARRIGQAGQRIAVDRFDIRRFARDWEETFAEVAGRGPLASRTDVAASQASGMREHPDGAAIPAGLPARP
jgi:hypothetical protein